MKTFKLIIIAIIFILFSNDLSAQRIRFQTLYFEYSPVQSVKLNNQDYNTNQYGFGINFNGGTKFISGVLEYDYRYTNLEKLKIQDLKNLTIHEFYFGLRYYSMEPTFLIGNSALRITGGYLYGFDLDDNWKSLYFIGLAFSPITSTSGVTLSFTYRPNETPNGTVMIEPTYSVRIGFILGPSMQ